MMTGIKKLGTVQYQLVEVSPFVYQRRLLILESVRPNTPDNTHGGLHYLRIRELHDGTRDVQSPQEFQAGRVLTEFAEGFTFAVPFIRGDEVFVYASLGVKEEESDDIYVFRSADLHNWEQSVAIVGDRERLFNCSVCTDSRRAGFQPAGQRFVMCYETNDATWPAFTIKFAESADLVTWAKLPVSEAIYGTDRYTACPSMRWLDGHFYMFYLERMGGLWRFETYLTRSPDLLHWEGSPANPILAPEPDEDINNSDIDFTEFEGRVVIYYSWGSQRGEEHLAHATFDGTLSDWLRECYP